MPGRVATAVSILLLVSALLTFQPLARAAEPVHAPAKGSTDWSTVREAVRQIGMRRYKAGLTVEMQSLRVQDESGGRCRKPWDRSWSKTTSHRGECIGQVRIRDGWVWQSGRECPVITDESTPDQRRRET